MTAVRSIVFLRLPVYNGKRPGDRLTHDIFKEDIMKKVLLAILVVAVIGTMCFAAVACGDEQTVVESNELTMLMENNYYVGTEGTVDLSKALPGSGYTVTGSNAALSGSTLTVKGTGEFTLKYSPSDKEAEGVASDGTVTLTMHAVEGVNVTDWAGLTAAVAASKDVVVQSDIASEGKTAVEVIDSTIYGNAKELNVNSIISGTVKNRGGNAFNVSNGNKAVFRDIHFTGYKYAEGQSVVLETCEGYGQIINGISTENDKRTQITIKHCILENSQKMVYLKGAVDCTVEGTIMRNGADALLAAETCNYDGVDLTVKNSVFANSVVCGIILCGWTEVANDNGYCNLTLEGFVDIYNWKSRDTAKLMPATEGFYVPLVNGLVQSQLGKEEYNGYFSKGSDGMDYVHFGIVVLATGDLSENKSTVNGAEGVGLVEKKFPLPPAASKIAHTCLLYGIDKNNITIEPTATIASNENLAYELIHGRNK